MADESDVCKHCTRAACLEVCPTGALFRTEFGTVVVQPDVCNGCGYCVPACPFGVIDRREDDGRAWKCTLCYDRLQGRPGAGVREGVPDRLDPVRRARGAARARRRRALEQLHDARRGEARSCTATTRRRRRRRRRVLPAARRARGLRPAARPGRRPRATCRRSGARGAAAARARGAAIGGSALGRERGERGEARRTYYGRPVIKTPVWTPEIPCTSSRAGWRARRRARASRPGCAATPELARRALARRARRRRRQPAAADLRPGRPERFLNMLRVFKVTSPMSVGSWVARRVRHGDRGGRPPRTAGSCRRGAASPGRPRVLGLPLVHLHRRACSPTPPCPVVARGAPRAAVRVRRRDRRASAGARWR